MILKLTSMLSVKGLLSLNRGLVTGRSSCEVKNRKMKNEVLKETTVSPQQQGSCSCWLSSTLIHLFTTPKG